MHTSNMLFTFVLLAVSALASSLPQCPPLGSPQYLLPHDTDCTKFYICAHGIPLLQNCPDGTHFNPIFMVCQNPVFAGCDSSPPDSELPCTWPDSIVHRPHPESCEKYYVCEFGTAVVFNCPEGLEFNAQLQECVWPHQSDCSVQGSIQDGGAQPQDGCRSGALSRHEECGKYYLCAHGVNVAMDCPSGLQWSSQLEQCAWPQHSDCGVLQTDVSQNGAAQDSGAQSQDVCRSGALSRHEECGKYYLCAHGVNVAMDCPSGLQWSSKLEQCSWPQDSDCGVLQTDASQETGSQDAGSQDTASQDTASQDGDAVQNGGQDGCENGALFAHEDCSKYYMCSHGVYVAMDCPAGLQWNSQLSFCDWPVAAGCGK